MMRRSVVLGFFVSLGVAVGLFHLKYKVAEQERHLAKISQEVYQTDESIHLLQAEWSYLNEPGRLQKLAETHLGLSTSETVQLVTFQQIEEFSKPKDPLDITKLIEAKY